MLLPSKHIRIDLVLQTVRNIGTLPRCPHTRQTVLRMYNVHITIVFGEGIRVPTTRVSQIRLQHRRPCMVVSGNFTTKHYHKSRYVPRKPVS